MSADVAAQRPSIFVPCSAYYRARTGEAELDEIYNDISKLDKKELSSRQFSQYEDRFQIFLAIGLLLLIIELVIPERKKVKSEWKGRFV